MNLLALDQASKTSGFSIFKDGKLETFGTFTFDDADIGVRLNKIRDAISLLVADYDIDYILFEDIQLQDNIGNNVATFKILAEVFGIVEELATELVIPHSAVPPLVWKSAVGIKGKYRSEQKKAAQAYVKEKYDMPATEDESDAICIGTYFFIKDSVSAPATTQPAKRVYRKKNIEPAGFDWSD